MKTSLLLLAQTCVHVLLEDTTNASCGDRCCVNHYKDINGSCIECQLGKYGLNCSETCPTQYYGKLCKSRCACPLHLCDIKYGCDYHQTNDESTWKNVAFTLIGLITIVVAVGVMMLMKSLLAKRCTLRRDILMSNSDEREDTGEEHRYEGQRRLQSPEDVENEQPHDQADENNYTDLRRSALSPIYDNPEECKPSQNLSVAPADATKSLAVWDLSSDEEEDSSDDEEGEDEGYGKLFKHGMYNVLSLRRTYPDKTIHIRPVLDDTMISNVAKETRDGYQSIQLATTKVSESKEETSDKLSKSLSEKTTIRQSLISETIEEYIQTSRVSRNHFEDKDKKQDLVITDKKSQTEYTGTDKPLPPNSRPYSLANISWTSDSLQNKTSITESITEDQVYEDNDDNKDEDGFINETVGGNENEKVTEDEHIYEESRPYIKINEGNESREGNDMLQKSCREKECETQPEKIAKDDGSPLSCLTKSPEENSQNSEFTQVIQTQLVSLSESGVSQRKRNDVGDGSSMKTTTTDSLSQEKEKVLSELIGSRLEGTDKGKHKDDADIGTSGDVDLDITYCLIKTSNL